MNTAVQRIFSVILLAISYIYFIYRNDYSVAFYTIASSCFIFGLYCAFKTNKVSRLLLAYAILTITPALTLTGQIGPLTGFARSEKGLPWLGVSFVTLGLGYMVYKNKLNIKQLFLNVLQPLRFSSGPVSISTLSRPKLTRPRAQVYFGWLVLGAFLYGVLAAGLAPLLFLKTSTHALDIWVFGIVFEIYVYLNFAGISFMVYGLLNLVGIPTMVNFNTPFASKDIIEYWQRWHLSFSAVLKEMFFNPLRKHLGLGITILVVFMASAMWHGVTFNFIAWGLFHGTAWMIVYRISRLPWPRFAYWLNLILLPFIVVLGRIIFAQSDTSTLMTNLNALVAPQWSNEAYLLNLVPDTKTFISVIAALLFVMMEIFFFKLSHGYKYLRKTSATLVLLLIIALFGTTGLESVYGAR